MKLTTLPFVAAPTAKTIEIVDSRELAKRWAVPESWIRNHTQARTPEDERIPCVRLGRYVRFEIGSPALEAWWAKHRTQ